MARVAPPDLGLWLNAYARTELVQAGKPAEVGNKEPDDLTMLDGPLVVIRIDPGRKLSPVSFDCSIGVSVLAGSRQDDKPARDLARLLLAILTEPEIVHAPGSPIAAVVDDGINGPYAVNERQDLARLYFTAQYVVTGEW